MREIEGIEHAVEVLRPHMDDIDAHFEAENEKFKALIAREHDDLGRILKCHLIVEHYMNQFLISHYSINEFDQIRLTFSQKSKLLPSEANAVAFVKPGIQKLNLIRNKFGHRLDANLEDYDLGAINEILNAIRPDAGFNNLVEKIEAFTTIACTWLIIPPQELQDLFIQAFRNVRAHDYDL